MKKGKYHHSKGIQQPNEETIREIGLDEGYKYLRILEADGVKDNEMREKIEKEYYTRVRMILKSKLNGPNTITAINSRVISIVRHSVDIIK